MTRRFLLVLLVLGVVAAACGNDDDGVAAGDAESDATTTTSGEVDRTVEQAAPSTTSPDQLPSPAPVGDRVALSILGPDRATAGPVTWVIDVANPTEEDVTLTFPTGQRVEILLSAGEREVHRWSADRFFTQEITEVVVPAGGSVPFEVGDDLSAVDPGSYAVEVQLSVIDPPAPATGSVRIDPAGEA